MSELVSPGVSVRIIDESNYATGSPGTVPLFFVVTRQDKVLPDGETIAPATTKENANKLQLITSQRDSVQQFGTPVFRSVGGTVQQGGELNEYGLHALYSYLGISRRAYAIRSDLDVDQLVPTSSVPAGDPENGTYWLDLSETEWGIFRANGNTVAGLAWDRVTSIIFVNDEPAASTGSNRTIAIDVSSNTNTMYEKVSGEWHIVGSSDWTTALGSSQELVFATHTQIPNGENTGDIWIKTTSPNFGASWATKVFSSQTGQWNTVSSPLRANAVFADEFYGSGLGIGNLYVKYDSLEDGEANFTIFRYDSTNDVSVTSSAITTIDDGTATIITLDDDGVAATYNVVFAGTEDVDDVISEFEDLEIPGLTFSKTATDQLVITSDGKSFRLEESGGTSFSGIDLDVGDYSNWTALTYEASVTEPVGDTPDGTLWYDEDFKVDLLVSDGSKWNSTVNYRADTDPEGPILSAAIPTTQSDGSPLVDGDVWVDTADTENYPAIYYRLSGEWLPFDKTDNSSAFGIIFADARENAGPEYSGSSHEEFSTEPEELAQSDYVDPDAPDPRLYPPGLVLFNTRYSTRNVKEYDSEAFSGMSGTFTVGNSENFPAPGTNDNPEIARWLNKSGNDLDGSPFMGRKAQRAVVIEALRETINSVEELRSEFNFFSLLSAPGYFEVYADLVELNIDRKETAFIVTDPPPRLRPNGTEIQNWATNANNAPRNGEEGRVTRYTFSTVGYPWGLGTNVDGTEVMIPWSTMKMRVFAFNDQVSYLWFPAAGVERGVVTNATSVGFLNAENQYEAVTLSPGLRDVLYTNAVNPTTPIPNEGLLVYGYKTQQAQATATDRENVARLIAHLRFQLDVITRPFLFRLNTERTRAEARRVVERFLADLLSKEALTDFVVQVDDTNNTPDRIDRNELWIDIGIEPTKGIDFIYVPVRIQATGTL